MKNLINETPITDKLYGRHAQSIKFVNNSSIKNQVILDIGCGYGWFESYLLSQKVKKVVGLELTQTDLESLKKNVNSKKVNAVLGSAISIPFPDNSFDTIVAWEVIEHIPFHTEKDMFAEIYRVLKPGGYFYLSTPYNSFLSKVLDPAWWLIGHRHYSTKKLFDLGNSNGFTVEQIKIFGKWWTISSLLNMYFSKWILRRKSIMKKLFVEKEDLEYQNDNGFMNIFVCYLKK